MGGTEVGNTWNIRESVDPTRSVVTVEWHVFHDTPPQVGDTVVFGHEAVVGQVVMVDTMPARLVVTVVLDAAAAKTPAAEPVHDTGPRPPLVLDVGDVDARKRAEHLLGPAMEGTPVTVEAGGSVYGVVTEVVVDDARDRILMVVVRVGEGEHQYDARIPWNQVTGIATPTWTPPL